MSIAIHIVGGLALIAVGVWFIRRAARIDQLPHFERSVDAAEAMSVSRRHWLWQLRIGNVVAGTAGLVAGVIVLITT